MVHNWYLACWFSGPNQLLLQNTSISILFFRDKGNRQVNLINLSNYLPPFTKETSWCQGSRFIHRILPPTGARVWPTEDWTQLIVGTRQRRCCAAFWGEHAGSFPVFGYDLLVHANCSHEKTARPSMLGTTAKTTTVWNCSNVKDSG